MRVDGRIRSSFSSIAWSGSRLSAAAGSSSESRDGYLYSLRGLLALLVALGLQLHQLRRFGLAKAGSRRLFVLYLFLAAIFVGPGSMAAFGLIVCVGAGGFDGNPVLFPAGRDEIDAPLEDLDLVVAVDLAH